MSASDLVMVGSYDYRLVALSVLISLLAAYAALDLAERMTVARGGAWLSWLIGGATASGIGTWSMHYIGMLAFQLPVPVQYDWPTVLLSLFPALFASAVALFVVSRRTIGSLRGLASGILVGEGIAALHSTAMAAMRLPAMSRYSPALVTLSVVFPMVISLMAIWLTFLSRHETTGQRVRKAASILLLGGANPIMHYTGMAATSFLRSAAASGLSHAVSITFVSMEGITIVPLMVLGVALVTSLVDRLQKERAHLDELFEQAPQAVVLLSVDNRVVRVSREFTRVFGYTPQETRGRRLSELIVPDESRDTVHRYADLTAQGQRVDAEGVRLRKDGSRLYVAMVRVPVSVPGGQIAVYEIYRDITERRRAEEDLRVSEAKFRALSDTAPAAIFIYQGNGFRYANPAAEVITGYSQHELLRMNFWDIAHPDVRDLVRERGHARQRGEPVPQRYELKIVTKSGEERWLDFTDGKFELEGKLAIVGMAFDITERKRTEAELRTSLNELRALAARLQSVREEERTRVAREIHDVLGQALTAMKIDLTSLLRELPGDKGSAVQRIHSTLRFLDETIGSVRKIATELRPGILDDLGLVAAVEWAGEEFEARTGIRCRISLPEGNIAMDPERATALFRIFQETLTNVARHANATEVDVRLFKEDQSDPGGSR